MSNKNYEVYAAQSPDLSLYVGFSSRSSTKEWADKKHTSQNGLREAFQTHPHSSWDLHHLLTTSSYHKSQYMEKALIFLLGSYFPNGWNFTQGGTDKREYVSSDARGCPVTNEKLTPGVLLRVTNECGLYEARLALSSPHNHTTVQEAHRWIEEKFPGKTYFDLSLPRPDLDKGSIRHSYTGKF